jgi:thiopeptide-type bacteriocin biosynthesis protein
MNNMEQNNKPNSNNLQRTFILGDQWLYYKFYTGPKTADIILTRLVKPLAETLLASGDIDKWFFIRYADPKIHTRVRFRITNPQGLLKSILQVNMLSKPFIEQDLIWKIQVDSYQREIERYGIESMDLSETLFFHDSRMIVDMLDMIEGDEGERIRWLFGLRAVDSLLNDFQYSIEEKYDLVTRLRENFGREFSMDRSLKDQLEKKFRAERKEIENLMDPSNDRESVMYPLFQMISRKSQDIQSVNSEILALYNNKEPNPFFLNDLMSSYSHMMVNRLFKSKQRLHELVLYDFLHRLYKSEIGRRKYSKMNKEKKKEGKKEN